MYWLTYSLHHPRGRTWVCDTNQQITLKKTVTLVKHQFTYLHIRILVHDSTHI